MIAFPLGDLLDPDQCYEFLVKILHPNGLQCPNGHALDQCSIYQRHLTPLVRYQCSACRRTFNAFTLTALAETKLNVVQIVQTIRGITKGEPTLTLAEEIDISRQSLLKLRHKLQGLALKSKPTDRLPDMDTETDEMFQNAGEKRRTPSRSRRSSAATGKQEARQRNLRK